MTARSNSKFRKISIVQWYAATEPDDDETEDQCYSQLDSVTRCLPKGDIKFVIKDFNARVGNNNNNPQSIIGMQGLGDTRNYNSDGLVDFCSRNRLLIGGTKFPHKNIHKSTTSSFWPSLKGLKQEHKVQPLKPKRPRISTRIQGNIIGEAAKLPPCMGRHNSSIYGGGHLYNRHSTTIPKTMDKQRLRNALLWTKLCVTKTSSRTEYRASASLIKRPVRRDKRIYFNMLAEQAENAAKIGNMRGVYESIKQMSGHNIRPTAIKKYEHGSESSTPEPQLEQWRGFFSCERRYWSLLFFEKVFEVNDKDCALRRFTELDRQAMWTVECWLFILGL
ncbi:uncharacterized protein LOC131997204 [Stomoxys calcitrans]|uniref:uncharacterized protein LOC131997204 n=1 Tax=Stomoxys calcitrans TaxID=35570 RepID=UPI0027E3AF56|nr:uncharacterized protein LOC131997204 [Stomoxys calcitrans]